MKLRMLVRANTIEDTMRATFEENDDENHDDDGFFVMMVMVMEVTFIAPESIMVPSILPTLDVIACKSLLYNDKNNKKQQVAM